MDRIFRPGLMPGQKKSLPPEADEVFALPSGRSKKIQLIL
jgi:hypothetical protein